jgi:arabinan endo-1,5-alpha-L-arabinosidase
MEGRWHNLFAACGLAAGLGACHAGTDIVAWSDGDYDPQNPPEPRVLAQVEVLDPFLFRSGETYWVFSTGPGIVRRSSRDLVTFKEEEAVFAENPAWITQKLPKVGDLWSPEVHAFGGLFHLYYGASAFGSGQACIGHATTSSLDRPFQDHGSIICSGLGATKETYDAIDPTVILDAAGAPWMAFGSGEIHLLALDTNGSRVGDPLTLAARPGEKLGIQASFLYHWRGHYYLFGSFDYNPVHTLRVGRSEKVTGPYVDREGRRLLDGGGTLLLSSGSRFVGPGSNSILDDNGQRWNSYHVYDSTRNNTAVLRIAPLFFDNDGWPVTAGP